MNYCVDLDRRIQWIGIPEQPYRNLAEYGIIITYVRTPNDLTLR